MTLNTIAELIFVIVMLLFFSIIVVSVLVIITILQELAVFDVSFKIRTVFLFGMSGSFFYLMKMIVDKIKDCNRYAS